MNTKERPGRTWKIEFELGILFFIMPLALYLNFIWGPNAQVLGFSERIFYFHMGSAVTAALAFTFTAVSSLCYVFTKRITCDLWVPASAEAGTVLTAMILVSGILWGRVAWGIWWTWNPKLTATVVLWLFFSGYLVLRELLNPSWKSRKILAIYALLAYLDVPFDYLLLRKLPSIHPILITFQGINMAPPMIVAMVVSMIAFVLLLIAWMRIRLRLWRVEMTVRELQDNGVGH